MGTFIQAVKLEETILNIMNICNSMALVGSSVTSSTEDLHKAKLVFQAMAPVVDHHRDLMDLQALFVQALLGRRLLRLRHFLLDLLVQALVQLRQCLRWPAATTTTA
jgi:hypothetical protein